MTQSKDGNMYAKGIRLCSVRKADLEPKAKSGLRIAKPGETVH